MLPGQLRRARHRQRLHRRPHGASPSQPAPPAADFTLRSRAFRSRSASGGHRLSCRQSRLRPRPRPSARCPTGGQRGHERADRRPAHGEHGRRHPIHAGRRDCPGRGNRDTPILAATARPRTSSSMASRRVQYFRDVYNVDRVEALKGPNAMIFGRGGVGGVINRVTRQADWGQAREASLQFGSWNNRRFTADLGRGLNQTVAVRATALYENSDSYRDGVGVERYGFNPTVGVPSRVRTPRSAAATRTSTTSGSRIAASRRSTGGRWRPIPAPSSAIRRRAPPMPPSTWSRGWSSTGSVRASRSGIASATATTTSSTRTCSPARSTRRHHRRHLRL